MAPYSIKHTVSTHTHTQREREKKTIHTNQFIAATAAGADMLFYIAVVFAIPLCIQHCRLPGICGYHLFYTNSFVH